MKRLWANLGATSNGSGGQAALVLVVAHLLPGVVMVGLWWFGLLAFFDDRRWIPTVLAAAFGIVAVLGLFFRFGIWGTPATRGEGFGEQYEQTFSPRLGFGLGWLRWFMQLVLVFVVLIPGLMIWTDVRPWHLVGTDELRELPDRAAEIPVPDDWTLTDTEASGFGLTQVVNVPDGRTPEGFVEQTFEVPASYTFDDLKEWLESPDWAEGPDGDPFGAIQRERCDTDTTTCDVRRVPDPGEQPEYFIRARFDEPSYDGDEPEVELRLAYRQYVAPDWDVSDETVERAMAIPVPVEWVFDDVLEGKTTNGENFAQFFAVPESYTRADLEAWLAGDQWTAPLVGEPFGEIEVDGPCREVGPGETNRTYLCSAFVVGTRRSEGSSGPVESLSVSLSADGRVRVSLERNG